MIKMLCFIGKQQQPSDVLMKASSALSVSQCLGANKRVVRCLVMVVTLIIGLAWVGAVIAQPSPVKPLLVCDKWSELPYSDLQSWKPLLEKGFDVVRPVAGDGVDAPKLGQDSGAELGTSGHTPSLDAGAPPKPRDSNGNDSADDWAVFSKWIGQWLPIWILAWCAPIIFSMQHNVLIQRTSQRSWRRSAAMRG